MAVTALLDVNVLIALAWRHHVHHDAAREWFDERREDGWATCVLTEAGFVRLSCTPSAVRYSVAPLDAISVLEQLTRLGSHRYWSLDRSILDLPQTVGSRIQGYRQITDAVLLAAAMQHHGQLATFDTRIHALVAETERSALCVIPV